MKKVEFVRVSKNVRASTEKESNECKYRKMAESGRDWEKVESVRVPKNCPGEYRETVDSVRVSKNFPREYRKRVESV